MPITRQQFENEGTNKVLGFLKQNKNFAYTRNEIAAKLKLELEYVSTVLRYHKSKGRLQHKKPYWLAK